MGPPNIRMVREILRISRGVSNDGSSQVYGVYVSSVQQGLHWVSRAELLCCDSTPSHSRKYRAL
ncbi:unnamed protein product [Orchesella dallaii]|uniref:Uncharacterized protein n=1 Tax=Orchesella dallaii TaxID=48710 RepID=A0ABP1PP04_9HEXA